VKLKDGSMADRIPAWINFTRQNQDNTFDGMYVDLSLYQWKNQKPVWENVNVKVYECHIGMSGVEEKVHSFTYFRENVLPRIKNLGYNVIQIMGIIEHPYYGSFGYHCSNFFSVSSRFGTPCEFKQLVDEAHGMGIKIIIDLVHSHAAKNVLEGINLWDGTDYQYFHGGEKGNHPMWDSRVFDYSKYEVLRFLLSNIRFWIEEYSADGYRFDGVTSMLYEHHGKGYGFTGNYNEYFNSQLDIDALAYLTIANQLAKTIYPQVILVGEDVSGFPGLCRPIE
jgi:1,4-alpha-glucan branching enzyme